MKGVASMLCSALLVVAQAGCGSGSPGAAGNDVGNWVDDVCSRMTALDREVSAERAVLDAGVTDGADVNAVLSALEQFLGDVGGSVGLAGDDLVRLGVPAIDGDSGVQLRNDISDLFDRAVQETGLLEASARRALSDPSGAMDEINSLSDEVGKMTDLDEEMRSILTDYRQLRNAFEESASCDRWLNQPASPTTTATHPTTLPTTTTTPTTTTVPPTTVPPTTVPPTTVPPTTVAPTTAPPTTPAPTAPPVTVDPYIAVRDMYLVAADEYNPKFDQVWFSFHDSDGFILFTDAPTYCGQMATLEREWADRMTAIPWPPDAIDEYQAQSAESAAALNLYDQCAAAPGTRSGQDALLDAIEIEDEFYFMAVDALRMAIGLSPIHGG